MAQLDFGWPFSYQTFDAAATPWAETHWTPAELAFNAAQTSEGSLRPIFKIAVIS